MSNEPNAQLLLDQIPTCSGPGCGKNLLTGGEDDHIFLVRDGRCHAFCSSVCYYDAAAACLERRRLNAELAAQNPLKRLGWSPDWKDHEEETSDPREK